MEPYKFEQDIKNKLEKRTIKPTKGSWDSLANSLKYKEDKKKNKLLILMGVAASIVGVLFIVSLFFNKENEKIMPTVVTVPAHEKKESTIQIKAEKLVVEEQHIEELKSNENNTQEKSVLKPIYKAEIESKIAAADTEKPIIKVNDISKIEVKEELEVSSNIDDENQEIELVINKIEELKTNHFSVSTSDVDLLLKNAQKELALQKIYNENIKIVDAYKLLQDVEADLDKSTRVKFLETLKMNYESMKTVIAQRNN
ncbi:hypothetical protein [Lutibacter citreus]|uniref:hypothetical protein n=1 Tax=Lutibacter citreus TaxID=2138210 RepID=UPI000DBE24C2|nr:hypothetical protein [Lutibacter citreus]